MQKNLMESLVKFIVKYIWLFCITLTILECIATLFSANVLMKRTSDGVMQSICGEVSSRVESVLNLITGLSKEGFVSDTTQPVFNRAVSLYPLQLSCNLFMIAVTDEAGNVSSADEEAPSEEKFNLMFRDYMQRLYSTGTYQITDPIVSGADGKTVNYTIAVPILKDDGQVAGSVFGSIYFDEIQDILNRSASHASNIVYLFGREQTIISQTKDMPVGSTFADLSKNAFYFGMQTETLQSRMEEQDDVNFWVAEAGRLYYVQSRHVPPADWTLLYCTDFFTMVQPLLPIMIFKIATYFGLCYFVSRMGRRYLARHLAAVNNLLNKMGSMQSELFQNDSADYTNLLDITQSGLVDQLTGLPTRTLFSKKMETWHFDGSCRGAVMFIDLDGLKSINDNFGHEAGDEAILGFAQILKHFEADLEAVSVRYGGDEFILVIRGHDGVDMETLCIELCKKMRSEIISSKGNLVPIRASIGIAIYPNDGEDLTDLICKADLALYASKHKGKDCFSFYSDLDIT